MKVTRIGEGRKGVAEIDGNTHDVDLRLLKDVKIGDHVIVHAGFAIEKLDEAEANTRIALFEELATKAFP